MGWGSFLEEVPSSQKLEKLGRSLGAGEEALKECIWSQEPRVSQTMALHRRLSLTLV